MHKYVLQENERLLNSLQRGGNHGSTYEKCLKNTSPIEKLVTLINRFLYFITTLMYLLYVHIFTIHFLYILTYICMPNIVSLFIS